MAPTNQGALVALKMLSENTQVVKHLERKTYELLQSGSWLAEQQFGPMSSSSI